MGEIIEDPLLRDQKFVFSGRHDAGQQLGALVATAGLPGPLVLAIPAGGVPVGIEVAKKLNAPFSLAIVRKIRIPGTTESGFGAVTWDGDVLINEPLKEALELSDADVNEAIEQTKENVRDRIVSFTGGRPFPDIKGRTVILTDDGLASGYTMLAAIRAVRRHHPAAVVVAVPTASAAAAAAVARHADRLVCVNIRSGRSFAVADAYREWYDLDDREVMAELGGFR